MAMIWIHVSTWHQLYWVVASGLSVWTDGLLQGYCLVCVLTFLSETINEVVEIYFKT